MPPAEQPKLGRVVRRRRPKALLTDYMSDPAVAARTARGDIEEYVSRALASPDVRERIEKQLAASPTARLGVAVFDLDPSDAFKHAFQTHSPSGEQYFTGATERSVEDAQTVPVSAQRAKAQSASVPTDSFVGCLYEAYKGNGVDAAVDYVYEAFHPLIIQERDFPRAARILAQIKVDALPPSVLIGLLMTTYAHKTNLETRKDFFAQVKMRLIHLPEGGVISPYLDDLE
jgi:hypothetical protein